MTANQPVRIRFRKQKRSDIGHINLTNFAGVAPDLAAF